MGLFETPLVLGLVLLGIVVLVGLRWRGRRPDEWRNDEKTARAAPEAAREERSTERP